VREAARAAAQVRAAEAGEQAAPAATAELGTAAVERDFPAAARGWTARTAVAREARLAGEVRPAMEGEAMEGEAVEGKVRAEGTVRVEAGGPRGAAAMAMEGVGLAAMAMEGGVGLATAAVARRAVESRG